VVNPNQTDYQIVLHEIDQNAVLDAIKAASIEDNTPVVSTSDNGLLEDAQLSKRFEWLCQRGLAEFPLAR
jgi:arylsulfatase A-like enzyme